MSNRLNRRLRKDGKLLTYVQDIWGKLGYEQIPVFKIRQEVMESINLYSMHLARTAMRRNVLGNYQPCE
ncbi:hypothetical protein PMI28_01891 [Pseudomonas sp. GM48]|nr:hypothetical protein PMI28_01891 [Pseudomonas sp. GM48]